MSTPPPRPGGTGRAGVDGPGAVLERRYRLDGVIARGGMSVVHRGMDLRLERPVAVKVMDRTLARDPAFVRRFELEARAAARLAHPGIVAVHDQGRDADGTVFLVLELVEGGTLRDVLREHERVSAATALTVVEQVVTALRIAHRQGLVHQDVKPENVLISAEGVVKVADFGLVGAAGPGGVDHDDDLLLGTAAYLSPEQVADGRADARSDLYSAGIVLFELLTGAPPYSGPSAAAIARRHVREDVPAPSSWVDNVPRALDELCLSLTSRDPGDRPPNAAAFLADARQVRVDDELAYVPVPPPRRLRGAVPPPPRQHSGTRLLDLGEPETPEEPGASSGTRPEASRGVPDAVAEPGDDPPASPRRPLDRPLDDVDDRIERLERRRARARARRLLVAWVLVVLVLTVAAGAVGWNLGLPG